MTGRFVVNKELLQLSIEANQNLEMSENLDNSEAFKNALAESLAKLDKEDVDVVKFRKSVRGAQQIESMITMQREKAMNEESIEAAALMDADWMNFKID